jgi:hypothetical protein
MARTRDIRTNQSDVACDVCGRTLLRGEQAENFLAAGQRRQVCELCTARAQHEGWIRESGGDDLALRHTRHDGRGRSFLDRLRSRRERAREVQDEVSTEATPAEPPEPPRERPRDRDREQAPDERSGGEASGRDRSAAEPPRRPRHVRAVPTNADLKIARALDVFNASAHPRRIAGVSRSLGVPIVSVMPSETAGAMVSIVVGWELCWYRYEVDLADEAAGVRVIDQGAELSELTDAEQVPNAAADERGLLILAA